MSVQHIPAKPAVTELRPVTVAPATPEQYVVTLSLHEALILAALSGCTGNDDGGLFFALVEHPLYEAYKNQRDEKHPLLDFNFEDLTNA